MVLTNWIDELSVIFKEETKIYKSILSIEKSKKDSILQSDAKTLESLSKETQGLISQASDLEGRRIKIIETIYESAKLEKKEESVNLSEFLNQIDRESNFKLKGLVNDLKDAVRSLKEVVTVNDKLLRSKKEIYSLQLEALKSATEREASPVYESGIARGTKSRTSVMINTKI